MPNAALPGNPDTVVIMPMYNEAAVVAEVLAELKTRFDTIVAVDDGSSDGTADIARALGVHTLRHSANLGQGAALATGLEYALTATDASYVLTFDADGQHRVQDAERLVEALRAGDVDVALGSRFLDSTTDLRTGRRLLLRAAASWTRVSTGLRVTDAHNGLRGFTRQAAARMNLRHRGMAHGSELLGNIARQRLSYREVPVTVLYTDYSRVKGQRAINAVNILYDLAVGKLRLAR